MESYLVCEDLWDVVDGINTTSPTDEPGNADVFKRWKQLNAKAEFVLKRSISHGLFDHTMRYKSTHEIWQTLDRLFNKKNEAWLQNLENELANIRQGNLSISEYFLKVKNLCSKISLLNLKEAISETQIRRIIIRGLKPECIPYVTPTQEWVQQPSLEEFENLLSSQESLAKQMASVSIKEVEGSALMARQKFVKNKGNQNSSTSRPYDQSNSSSSGVHGESSNTTSNKKIFKCYRCGETRHIKRFCRVKLWESNVADKIEEEDDWGNCFVAETKSVDVWRWLDRGFRLQPSYNGGPIQVFQPPRV